MLYDDGCDVLLTATRDGLSIDSDNPKDWNDNAPTEPTTEQVTSYRALIIAGPSEKGQELAAKVNAGEELTWEDVSSANWSVANSSSPAGYIYPSLWLQENYEMNITDLPHAVQSDSYGSAFARLASGQVDVLCTYADARRDYEDEWTGRSCWISLLTLLIKGRAVRQNISINVTGILSVHFYRKKTIGENSLMHLETMFPWGIANMQFIRIKFTKAFFEKKPRNTSRFYICLKETGSGIRCILRS